MLYLDVGLGRLEALLFCRPLGPPNYSWRGEFKVAWIKLSWETRKNTGAGSFLTTANRSWIRPILDQSKLLLAAWKSSLLRERIQKTRYWLIWTLLDIRVQDRRIILVITDIDVAARYDPALVPFLPAYKIRTVWPKIQLFCDRYMIIRPPGL